MPETDNGIVYHYCSLEAFKSIIENKCLWLCDVRKSNDSAERVYFYNSMIHAINRQLNRIKDKPFNLSANGNANYDKELIQLKTLLEVFPPLVQRAYCISFSLEGDLLSQWRSYADGGYGCAIGLDSTLLNDFNTQDIINLRFKQICYNLQETLDICHQIITVLSPYATSNIPIEKRVWDSAEAFVWAVYESAFHKSNYFHEECECRIAYQGGQYTESRNIGYFSISPRKYRVANRRLSTYHELGFNSIRDNFLCKIVLGPKCLATEDDIRMFLWDCGYDAFNVSISRSQVTYQ